MDIDISAGKLDISTTRCEGDILVGGDHHMIVARGNLHVLVGRDLNVIGMCMKNVLALVRNTFDATAFGELAHAPNAADLE